MAFDFITAALVLFNKVLEKWIPDANLRQQAAMELAQQANVQILGQIQLNQAEATSPSKFVSWWRPAVGWICLGGFAYQFVIRPITQSVLTIWFPTDATMVSLDMDSLMTLLFGMLGLGGYRTYEKIQGVTK